MLHQNKTNTNVDVVQDVESIMPETTRTKEDADGTRGIELSPKEQRQVLRKIDFRVTVVLGIINTMSLMDRGNLAAAAVAGMDKELDLSVGRRYSIVALVFFVPYLIFEFVSSIVARRVGSRRLLMTICMLWGIVMIGTGFVKNWRQLAGVRVLLGLFEAAFFPVVVHLLSAWYTRYEVQKRYALFLLLTAGISSFSGILVFGLIQMNGLAGLSGWRWTFIIEGIVTLVVGGVASFLVVDFPDKARSSWKFLTDRQIDWVLERVQEDRGDADTEPFSWRKFFGGGRHIPVWLYAIIFCCITTVVWCVSFFLPIILRKDMGFSLGASLCLTAPPYLFSCLVMLVVGWMGDKWRIRGPLMMANSMMAIVGLVILGWTKPSGVRYMSLFIINAGCLSNIPTAMAYQANNIRGQWMRAFGSATFVVGGGLGGVFGALVFGDGKKATSKAGIGACIGANVLIIIITVGLSIFFTHRNRLARQGIRLIHGHPGFTYSL